MNFSKLQKSLIFALGAAIVSRKIKPAAGQIITRKEIPDLQSSNILKPLEPITKAYWLLHPQKALYLWLFQKCFGFAWVLAKKYFKN